ncbi:MAG: hypothetical protein JXA13_15915 [Anaerolineales bacterium]|nr:hypothetical protein [Anaerolineales bacterium]
MNDLIFRIGTFFTLLGVMLVFLFTASDMAKTPNFDLLFIGLIILVFGLTLRRRYRIKPEPSNRFSGIRRLLNRSTEENDETH